LSIHIVKSVTADVLSFLTGEWKSKRKRTMKESDAYVVLVDENDVPIGIEKKEHVHSSITPLHRAFSLFLFQDNNELLLQQRSGTKKTWPLVWSNSCCGHPLPEESYHQAVIRRAKFELGIDLNRVQKISDYRYCFSKDGIMENEICPIYAGFYSGKILPDSDEIAAVKWIGWDRWLEETRHHPNRYSPWCVEETRILASNINFNRVIPQPF
jgi:isopentenyl-diphosphate delta-isomerase